MKAPPPPAMAKTTEGVAVGLGESLGSLEGLFCRKGKQSPAQTVLKAVGEQRAGKGI